MRYRLVLAPILLTLCAAGAAAQTTEPWSTPTRTRRVDPAEMERARPVPNPGPVDARLVGTWEVWIPGAVWYAENGQRVERRYTPGAAMNRLHVQADGSYRWDRRRGRLVEVRPWHAQEGRRYYRVVHPGGSEYDLYVKDDDGTVVLLFGGVGGHAATGTRVGAAAAAPSGQPTGAAVCRALRPGDRVQVSWNGQWYAATVLRQGEGTYRITYDGWASTWDEWVPPARIRTASGPGVC